MRFSFLSERFFFVMIKLLLCVVEINNTGVTGQSLPPKNTIDICTYIHTDIHTDIYISREMSI